MWSYMAILASFYGRLQTAAQSYLGNLVRVVPPRRPHQPPEQPPEQLGTMFSSRPHSSISRLKFARAAVCNRVGLTGSVLLSCGLTGSRLRLQNFKTVNAPHFLHSSWNYINPPHQAKLLTNSPSATLKRAKNPKCLNVTSTTISTTLLIIPILLTMCGITARWPMRSPKFWPGYLHLNPTCGTTTSKAEGSTKWETGSYGLRNIGNGFVVSVAVNLTVPLCFATEVRGLAKPTLGKREDARGGMLLTCCEVSSLVIDTLCRQAVGGNASVACFYSDFAAQEEQSPAAILGSVLKQVIGGLNEVPEAIVNAFRNREKVIGGQRLALAEIVEFLQDISASRSTFICIDALDECPSRYRMKLLDSLNQILQRSPGARIFLTGRPHIWVEVDKHLGRKVAIRSITPSRNDIIIFLRAKLREDPIPDAMDESLEEEIVQNIPDTVSEM